MSHVNLYTALLGPVVSEKSTLVAEKGDQYTFKIAPTATKAQVKEAIEKLFEVTVLSVNTVTIKGKTKRNARGTGKRSDVRKAYVRLAEGQEIDFLSIK
jgi:large subunit ribosomal protein L23